MGLNRLTAMEVQRLNKPGLYCDGGGLNLQVSDTGTKSWVFRFMMNRTSHTMGLGSIKAVSLADARAKASECRRLKANGINPLEARIQAAQERAFRAASEVPFEGCAKSYIEVMGEKWKNEKHRAQWSSTLETYAFPVIAKVAVGAVDTGMVLRILEPIWKSKTETASRLRGRIEAVLDFAAAKGWRSKDNPARWRGHLDKLLPRPTEIAAVSHHAALPIADVGSFCAELRSKTSLTSDALELLVLTVLRPGELVGARWEEIDLDNQIWTVPAVRMKKKVEHRIPLSSRAKEIFEKLKENSSSPFVFPGFGRSGYMCTNALLKLVKEMRPELNLTSHGFRSTFKDWAAEYTNFPNEVSEMALAHKVSDKVEAAYRRGDLFLKRRKLMEKWADFCSLEKSSASVISILKHG